MKKHLKELCRRFVVVIIDKASIKFAFVCRKYNIFKILAENSPNKSKNLTSTYSQTQKSKEELIETNIKYSKKFYLKITEPNKTLTIMSLLPKMNKKQIGARFMVARKTTVLGLCVMCF